MAQLIRDRSKGRSGGATEHQRDWLLFGGLWVLFTIIGQLLASLHLLPGQYAEEAKVVDDAYILLIRLAVPIFAGVCAALVTIGTRFVRWKPDDDSVPDGPPVRTHKRLTGSWVAVSAALCLLVAIDPGFVGLRDIRGEKKADIVVKVTAQRWSWKYEYPNGGTSTTELVLPVDKRVRFDITSIDIVHSFWVPAFRLKLDAVPGRTTKLYASPNRIGDYKNDPNLRVQCAELCGIGHAAMNTPVRVLSETDFEAYLQTLKAGA